MFCFLFILHVHRHNFDLKLFFYHRSTSFWISITCRKMLYISSSIIIYYANVWLYSYTTRHVHVLPAKDHSIGLFIITTGKIVHFLILSFQIQISDRERSATFIRIVKRYQSSYFLLHVLYKQEGCSNDCYMSGYLFEK